MDRPSTTLLDVFGNRLTVPTTQEHNDWNAICTNCHIICGSTFGCVPSADDSKYTACPKCSNVGEPNVTWIKWKESKVV